MTGCDGLNDMTHDSIRLQIWILFLTLSIFKRRLQHWKPCSCYVSSHPNCIVEPLSLQLSSSDPLKSLNQKLSVERYSQQIPSFSSAIFLLHLKSTQALRLLLAISIPFQLEESLL